MTRVMNALAYGFALDAVVTVIVAGVANEQPSGSPVRVAAALLGHLMVAGGWLAACGLLAVALMHVLFRCMERADRARTGDMIPAADRWPTWPLVRAAAVFAVVACALAALLGWWS